MYSCRLGRQSYTFSNESSHLSEECAPRPKTTLLDHLQTTKKEYAGRAAAITLIGLGCIALLAEFTILTLFAAHAFPDLSFLSWVGTMGSFRTMIFVGGGSILLFTGIILDLLVKSRKQLRIYQTLLKFTHGEIKGIPNKQTKRILIISMNQGSGHVIAANAIKDLVEKDGYQPEIFYPFDRMPGTRFFDIFQKAGSSRMQGLLTELQKQAETVAWYGPFYEDILHKIADVQPDLVISDQPIANNIPYHICKLINKPFIIVPTDFKTDHFFRNITSPSSDIFKVALPDVSKEEIASLKKKHEFKEEQLVVTGGPLRQGFQEKVAKEKIKEIKSKFGIERGDKTILIMKGGKGASEKKLLQEIKEIANSNLELKKGKKIHVIVVCGQNENLAKKIGKVKAENKNIVIHTEGFVDDKTLSPMKEIAHVFETKPGGTSVNESIAKNLYMILDGELAKGCKWEEQNKKHAMDLGIAEEKRTDFISQLQQVLNTKKRNLGKVEKWEARQFNEHFMALVHSMIGDDKNKASSSADDA